MVRIQNQTKKTQKSKSKPHKPFKMNNEFTQSFNYARIKPFKNYSTLNTRCVIYDTEEDTEVDPFSQITHKETEPLVAVQPKKFTVSAVINEDSIPPILDLNLYRKNSRTFYYTTNPTKKFHNRNLPNNPEVECDPIKLVSAKKITTGANPDYFETTKDSQIKRHYNNPFSSIEIYKIERHIRRVGNKVTIKQYNLTKTRKVNSKYFRKVTSSTTIIFDVVKGNFLIVIYSSHKKKVKKNFYSNSFNSLESALPAIFKVNQFPLAKRSPHHIKFVEEFDDQEFKDTFADILMGTGRVYGLSYDSYTKDFIHYWMPKFCELKKIKLPNDGLSLLKNFYPTERYLKKNDRKLIAAILDRIGILSKVTVKILHNHPDLELRDLLKLCHLLGKDYTKYLGSISNDFFLKIKKGPFDGPMGGFRYLLMEQITREQFELSKQEIENMVHIMNDVASLKNSTPHGVIGQFYDHFIMRDNLRQYYPNLTLNVRKWETFTVEHSRYSAMQRNIKRGHSTHLIFEKHILEAIEEPFEVVVSNNPPIEYLPDLADQRAFEKLWANHSPTYTKYMFKPKILKTSEDYADEGAHMHHCVAGYIDYSNSIIVSLRCGTMDRVTCEFSTRDKSCVQARYFSNKNAPDYYDKALTELKRRVKRIPVSISPSDKRQVPLLINGKPVIPIPPTITRIEDEPIRQNRPIVNDNGNLMWGANPAPFRGPAQPVLINNVDEFRDIFGEPENRA